MRSARLLLLSVALVGCSEGLTGPAVRGPGLAGPLAGLVPPPPLDGAFDATLSALGAASATNPAAADVGTTYSAYGNSRYFDNKTENNAWISFDGLNASYQARVRIHHGDATAGSGSIEFTNAAASPSVVIVPLADAVFEQPNVNHYCTPTDFNEGGFYCAVLTFEVVVDGTRYRGTITVYPQNRG